MVKVFVAGHNGMVGSAICRQLKNNKHVSLITAERSELDLIDQREVFDFFAKNKIDQVYLAAAKVGGIHANNAYPAEFIYENLMVQGNVIHAAFLNKVKNLLFLGSSCIYPKFANQPIREDALLTGLLESSNEPYAISKIAGIKLCESYNRQYGELHGIDYRSVMPTNLYGPGDSYHTENSHVIPALLRRFHEAKEKAVETVSIWGTGTSRREFLYVDDIAAACIHVMNLDKRVYERCTSPMLSHINVGFGEDITIAELAALIAKVVGFTGDIDYDCTKPDGTPQKLIDSSKINNLGWSPTIGLEKGLEMTYKYFLKVNDYDCR